MIKSLTYRNTTFTHGSIVIGHCQYISTYGYRFLAEIPPCYDKQKGEQVREKLSSMIWTKEEIVNLLALAWANQQVAGGWLEEIAA